tara:strand:+ start:470 stop:1408 length:939 start_codon:yes stop_codon:yes gene_type:complete
MKIVITESQFNAISESTNKRQNLCKTFNSYSSFCTKVEKMVKDGKTGGKENNLIKLSSNFFDKVVKNPNYFKTITLLPGNEEYETRMNTLLKFKDVLEQYKSCPDISSKVIEGIKNLPTKGLKMVVDDNYQYSLLNRLDTHYSAKAYLLTKIMLDELESFGDEEGGKKTDLHNLPDDKIRELITYVIDDSHVDEVSEHLKDLLDNDKTFSDYFFGTIEYSRTQGNQVEHEVFNRLREKYGNDKIIEFSEDYGFVDYFGVDGVLIIGVEAHPVQISSKIKYNPKIFKYASNFCKPLGYYKQGNVVTQYLPLSV